MRRISVAHPSLLHQHALPTHKVALHSATKTQMVAHLDSLQNVSILFPKAIHASLNPHLLQRPLLPISTLAFGHAAVSTVAASMHHSSRSMIPRSRVFGVARTLLMRRSPQPMFKFYLKYPFRTISEFYLKFSKAYPFLCAMITGGCVLTLSDFLAQEAVMAYHSDSNISYDYQRTLALFTFGFFYYGIVGKGIYMSYDRILGNGRALTKAAFDALGHTPCLLIPSFYMITGTVKGQTFEESWNQLEQQYKDACGFSILYWIPLMFVSFKFCSQETRVLFITGFSLIHKSVLSWFSNRNRVISKNTNHKIERQEEAIQQKPKEHGEESPQLGPLLKLTINTKMNNHNITSKSNRSGDRTKCEITFNFNSNIMNTSANTNNNIKNTIINKKGASIDDFGLLLC